MPGVSARPGPILPGPIRPGAIRVGLGVFTGLVSLLAMLRLVTGAFTGGMAQFAWAVTLAAMVPWVGYVAWRAHRARLGSREAVGVLALNLVGVVTVWLLVIGPVLALGLSFAAFAVVWFADRPVPRTPGAERYVRIEELTGPDESPDPAGSEAAGSDAERD